MQWVRAFRLERALNSERAFPLSPTHIRYIKAVLRARASRVEALHRTACATSVIASCAVCPMSDVSLLPWRPRVLRPCDMEYVMLHLIFSLPHA